MKNFELVQSFESCNCLDEYTPYLVLLEKFLLFFMLDNLLVEVTVIRKLHHYAISTHTYHRFLPSKNTSL